MTRYLLKQQGIEYFLSESVSQDSIEDNSVLVEAAVTIHLLYPVFIQLNHYVFSAHLINNHFGVTAENVYYSLHNQ